MAHTLPYKFMELSLNTVYGEKEVALHSIPSIRVASLHSQKKKHRWDSTNSNYL